MLWLHKLCKITKGTFDMKQIVLTLPVATFSVVELGISVTQSMFHSQPQIWDICGDTVVLWDHNNSYKTII